MIQDLLRRNGDRRRIPKCIRIFVVEACVREIMIVRFETPEGCGSCSMAPRTRSGDLRSSDRLPRDSSRPDARPSTSTTTTILAFPALLAPPRLISNDFSTLLRFSLARRARSTCRKMTIHEPIKTRRCRARGKDTQVRTRSPRPRTLLTGILQSYLHTGEQGARTRRRCMRRR